MKKYIILSLLTGFLIGVAYLGIPKVYGSLVRDRGTSLPNSYDNKTLLDATSTAGNPVRFATSTSFQIGGAKKVQFEFSVNATSGRAIASDFLIYVSPTEDVSNGQSDAAKNYLGYRRFRELVNTERAAPTTADGYYTRISSVTVNDGATSTAAMDLTYGAWRSVICVASTTPHAESNCKILVEF